MRATIGKLIKPAFDAVVDRFDSSTHLATHLETVRRLTSEPADGLRERPAFAAVSERIGGAGDPDASPFALWLVHDPDRPELPPTEPHPAPETFTEEAWTTKGEATGRAAWARLDHERTNERDVAALLDSFPPERWFIFKRGVFPGTSVLLADLVRWADTQGDAPRDPAIRSTGSAALRALVDVLDRLIKHIEVRRNDALPFHVDAARQTRSEAAAQVERLRFAMALIEASRVFGDLRYLNTAMKLVDRGLVDQRGQIADARNADVALAYLFAFCLQEERLSEVLTG
ncbi:MAG: hypothetical protein NXI30_17015 [bacterium]|nr:hypothetical protein [bacterium]